MADLNRRELNKLAKELTSKICADERQRIRAKVDEIENPYDFYSKREYEVGQYLAFKGGIEAAKEALK